jgi:hypothetical protein
MDLASIRRLVIIAMFSDDMLFDQLTLKGGNALNLVHNLGSRTSMDVDLSLEKDFTDLNDTAERIFRALIDRFAEARLAVFDEKFDKRPLETKLGEEKWGGYQVEFKLMDAAKYELVKVEPERSRREALVIGPAEQRVFRVQISKYEYCQGRVATDLDNYSIYVYTPAMVAIEKLRAICQQMPEYTFRRYSIPRARDFYDIHATVIGAHFSLGTDANLELARHIFAAKSVDPALIPRIQNYREFHRQDWPSVELTVSEKLETFDFYFDFVIEQAQRLKSLWEE